MVDELKKSWSGEYPFNRSPHIDKMSMNGKDTYSSVYVKPGSKVQFDLASGDPDKDKLTYRYEILPESTDIKSGGDKESRPDPISVEGKDGSTDGTLLFKAPRKEGAYRLFTYIYDGKGNAATANFPFYVRK